MAKPSLTLSLLVGALLIVSLVMAGCGAIQRKALFFPTHEARDNGLAHWTDGGVALGFAREVPDPQNVWLLLHGNGGQAADRAYALPAFSERDSVYIMEYPGYGMRPGKPSRRAFDEAARQAYAALRARFTRTPVCVAAESIGSGPASMLSREAQPPDHIVLIVPFDDLKSVARDHVSVPVGMLLAGTWDNGAALTGYDGPLEIFGAERDEVIPVRHAQALAARVPQARFHLIHGGHNEWSLNAKVKIRNERG
jgi:pimeloyl-ACP methyl ester carboxylesterase